jgi:hypothetical protein
MPSSSALFAGTFKEIGEFARMCFRFSENLQEHLTCDKVFVADLSNQCRIGFDLSPFEQKVFDNHFGQRRSLFRMYANGGGFARQFTKIEDRHAAELLNTAGQPVGVCQFLLSMLFEFRLESRGQ